MQYLFALLVLVALVVCSMAQYYGGYWNSGLYPYGNYGAYGYGGYGLGYGLGYGYYK